MKIKKIILFVLVIALCILQLPTCYASDVTTVIACSDFQNPGGNTAGGEVVSDIISAMKNDGITSVDGFFACGDYDYEYTETKEGVDTLRESVTSIVDTDMIFVQGNHDSAIGTAGMTKSGENDPSHEKYGVFVINEDDYMWFNDKPDAVKQTAFSLAEYLDSKLESGYDKPVFVVSHLPLHYSMRTKKNGDCMHANYIFDVLNAAGKKGLNIIFLFGHNHSGGWDDYLGNGAIYLEKGDSILIGQNTRNDFTSETLNFTYMNAGYVGYCRSSDDGDTALTMTVFKIKDDSVQIMRYSKDGIHNLKSKGIRNNYHGETAYDPDKTVYTSPRSLKLTSVTDKTAIPASAMPWDCPFSDVKAGKWYYSAVRFVNRSSLMYGVSDTVFGTDTELTRAMLVTVIYRLEGEPQISKVTSFTDVDKNSYYSKAVAWAKKYGIVSGYSDDVFGPGDSITREQIACIFHRYAKYRDYETSKLEKTSLSRYADEKTISAYAKKSVRYSVGAGLLQGKSDTALCPKDYAKRSEIAAVIMRFSKK